MTAVPVLERRRPTRNVPYAEPRGRLFARPKRSKVRGLGELQPTKSKFKKLFHTRFIAAHARAGFYMK